MTTEKSHITLAGGRKLKVNHDTAHQTMNNSGSSINAGKDTGNQAAPTMTMAQEGTELVTKPNDLNSIPRTHIWKGRAKSCKLTSDLDHMHAMAHVYHVHAYLHSLMYNK